MTTAQEQRGLHWFQALAGAAQPQSGLPASLRVADGELAGQAVRYIAVIADANNPFPRARNGEVGLLEGWGLAQAVDEAGLETGRAEGAPPAQPEWQARAWWGSRASSTAPPTSS